MREFHVQRAARKRYAIDAGLFGVRGDLLTTDLTAIRRLAARLDAGRAPEAPGVSAGDIVALGLLHEIGHLVVARYTSGPRPRAMDEAVDGLRGRLGPAADDLLERFAVEFPPPTATTVEPLPVRLEELLLIRIGNENPAVGPLRELIDDRPLERATRYRDAISGLEAVFAEGPPIGPDNGSLIELLRTPARRAPTSLAGQLRFIREAWAGLLGDALLDLIARLDLTLGILAEEERGLHLRFGAGGAKRTEAPSFAHAREEPEAFSSDSSWMPSVVLIAKSTYVWLDQLSRAYARPIRTLDAIPDEELDVLAGWGVTGLWLIGLWERSKASERIKRMRGNPDAAASAYSLDDYRIADDLGGEAACANLRERCWARGIRLASDMVPNHMGLDSRWVIDHPDWFLSVPEPPFPSYTFDGPDLSDDERVAIVLEDHYWNDSDAAVVFKRADRWSGDTRYVYHGNDGTSFPWNDTAQLDFLKAEVREQVIRTILDVARRFPIIRFDAAMVLARKHVERLWWPEPGQPGGIPSRAEHSLSKARFEALMPKEFWREVVDRVAAEVPGTLLLAEAFWMLEGYFVRTLGMHRVYNSAFMHMLRDEDGAGYRRVITETLGFHPEILKRYVNFMSNPDEATAVEQFGKGDKYFGVATLMATMPGLPMLGHGQVQGFGEKYGMEFRRATLDERPDPWLAQRHEREIFPLLRRRSWFAEASDFLLYEFVTDGRAVDEQVFAYSNGSGPTRSLVLFHDRFGSTTGTIRDSVPVAKILADGRKRLGRRSLADGLGLPNGAGDFVVFRDARTGLESIRSCRDIRERGLRMTLNAYEGHVFWEFREVHDGSAGQWARLAATLGDRAVASLDDAMTELQLEPVHVPLRAIFEGDLVRAVLAARTGPVDPDDLEARFATFLTAIASATRVTGDAAAVAASVRTRTERGFGVAAPVGPYDRATLLGWLALSRTGELAPGADVAATSRAWFDELRLIAPLAAGYRTAGLDEGDAWSVAGRVRVLLRLPRPSGTRGPKKTADARLLDAWLADDAVRAAIGVNTWEGVEWLERDRFAEMLGWAARLDAIEAHATADDAWADRLLAAAATAGYRVEALRAALTAATVKNTGRAVGTTATSRPRRPPDER
jgi:glycosidase